MANFTLEPPTPFGVGTTVGVYGRRTQITESGPLGPQLASAVTAADLTTTFTGLLDATAYWAAAPIDGIWRKVAISTGLGVDTSTAAAIDVVQTDLNTHKTDAGAHPVKANDSAVVHNAGDETVGGVKTFSLSPIVPTPTTAAQAATKAYADGIVAPPTPDATTTTKGKLQLAGDLAGTADLPTVPGLGAKANDSAVVHNTGAETVGGVKTFSASPVVPTPTTASQAATKGYADSLTPDTSSLVTLNPATSARNTIQPTGTAVVPLIVKAIASQGANLQEWQDSAGAVLVKVHVDGSLSSTGNIAGVVMQAGYYADRNNNVAYVHADTDATHAWTLHNRLAARVPLSVRGVDAQTANLQEWQNNTGGVLANVTAAGEVTLTAAGKGIIVKSPDGLVTRRIGIANDGTLSLTAP